MFKTFSCLQVSGAFSEPAGSRMRGRPVSFSSFDHSCHSTKLNNFMHFPHSLLKPSYTTGMISLNWKKENSHPLLKGSSHVKCWIRHITVRLTGSLLQYLLKTEAACQSEARRLQVAHAVTHNAMLTELQTTHFNRGCLGCLASSLSFKTISDILSMELKAMT